MNLNTFLSSAIFTLVFGPFELCHPQGTTSFVPKPTVYFEIKETDPNYKVYEYVDPYHDNIRGYIDVQENIIPNLVKYNFWVNKNLFFKSTDEIHENLKPPTTPVKILIELTCEAPYLTKWKFNSDYKTATEKENFEMDFSVQLMSRSEEFPFRNNSTVRYIKPATLTVTSFEPQFKSVSIDCVKYDEEFIKSRLYIFQRSDIPSFKDAHAEITNPLKWPWDGVLPCLVHDPHTYPILHYTRPTNKSWIKVEGFDYNWKSGFKKNSAKYYYEKDKFACQSPVNVVYYTLSRNPYILTAEITKTLILMTPTDTYHPDEWIFKCQLTESQLKSYTGNPYISSIRVESCLSPDYCDFNRNIDENRQYKNCTGEKDACQISKPAFNEGDKTELKFEGKVTCFMNFDRQLYTSHEFYFRGISGKYHFLSQLSSFDQEEILKLRVELLRSPKNSQVTLSVTCTALKFLTFTPLTLTVLYVNGIEKNVEVKSFKNTLLDNRFHGYKNVEVQLGNEMSSIECYVPWFNSTQWLKASHKLTEVDRPLITITTTVPTIKAEKATLVTTTTLSEPHTSSSTTTTPKMKLEEGGLANVPKGATTKNTKLGGMELPTEQINTKLAITATCTIVGLLVLMCLFACCVRQFCIVKFICCPPSSKSPSHDYELKAKSLNSLVTDIPSKYTISLKSFSVDYTKIVGQGQFSTVYQGCLKMDGKHSVVVKVNKTAGESGEISSILNDVKIRILAGDTHANVSSILGAYFDRSAEKVYIVMKSSTTRNMREFLTNKNMPMGQLKMLNMPPHEMIQTFNVWLKGVSKGLEFLHRKNIVHGNIAAENILVCFQNTELVSITGFSHSQQLPENATYFVKSRCWTCGWETSGWRWMPMESLRYMEFSKESDVWSFGVLMWEIFSLGAIPYSKLRYLKLSMEFIQKIEFGVRLGQPQLASKEIYRKMEACWSRYGKDRPKPKEMSRYFNEDPSNCINYINLAKK